MKYAYIRVSSLDQHEDRQVLSMKDQGIAPENMFIDKQTGANFDRPNYKKMLDTIQEGDVIYIHCIDRLGRNYEEIVKQWSLITREKNADIVVLDMPLLNTTVKDEDLTGKFLKDIVLQLLSYVADVERRNTKKRQMEGIAIAKEKGIYKKKDIDMIQLRNLKAQVDAGEISVTKAAEILNITRRTWYAKVQEL